MPGPPRRKQGVRHKVTDSMSLSVVQTCQFEEFEVVIKFKAGHSGEVPFSDIEKPPEAVFTCPLHPQGVKHNDKGSNGV